MKKLIKILPILMTVMMVFMAVSPVFAADFSKIKPTDPNNAQSFWDMGNDILGIIRIVGTVISVGVLMVLGIKYMMGSAQEKAEYKKTFIPYVIGVVLLFAATNIAPAIASFVNKS